MIDLSTLMLTVFYAAFGILLMVVSNIVIDLFIPGDFAAEIRRGVSSPVGVVGAGAAVWFAASVADAALSAGAAEGVSILGLSCSTTPARPR